MPHQLLRAHEVAEYVFNVADVEYPVSIRDQMNRACWLVQQAYDLGFFGPKREREYRRLLICGAGAAGVSAAGHALSLGVETVLIEKTSAPFLRQRRCASRWIDPTQYDWSAAWSAVDWTGIRRLSLSTVAPNAVAMAGRQVAPHRDGVVAELEGRREPSSVNLPAARMDRRSTTSLPRGRSGGGSGSYVSERRHRPLRHDALVRGLRRRAAIRAAELHRIRFLGD